MDEWAHLYPGLNYYIRNTCGLSGKTVNSEPETQLQSQWDWGAVLREARAGQVRAAGVGTGSSWGRTQHFRAG